MEPKMSTITINAPQITDSDTKPMLVKEVTAAATKAFGLPEATIVVMIKENRPENVGVGGILFADR